MWHKTLPHALALALVLVLMPGAARAWSMGGATGFDMAATVAEMKKMYEKMVEQLQEMKEQSSFLSETNELIKDTKKQYDAVQNLDLQRAIERVQSDADGLTGLDELQGRDLETQLLGISRELDRRLKYPLPEDERKAIEAEKAAVDREIWLQQLQEASEKNAVKAAGSINEREAQQIEAQSASILAALAASERREAARLERLKAQDAATAAQMEREQASMFRAFGNDDRR